MKNIFENNFYLCSLRYYNHYLVIASTTLASVSLVASGWSESKSVLEKVCSASRATSLNGPERYGASSKARNGDTISDGEITSAKHLKNMKRVSNFDRTMKDKFKIYLYHHASTYVVKRAAASVGIPLFVLSQPSEVH